MNCGTVENYGIENYNVKNYRGSDKPTFAGDWRILLGAIMLIVGLYIATLSNIQGHGLAFLMVFGSPFVIFKDENNSVRR